MTCSNGSGWIEISPVNGRSWGQHEQHGYRHPGGKEVHRDGGGRPIVAVDHRNRDQHRDVLDDHARPLDQIDLRSADDDALPPCVESVFERGGELPLRRPLASAFRRQRKGQLQRFGEGLRGDPQLGGLSRHLRP